MIQQNSKKHASDPQDMSRKGHLQMTFGSSLLRYFTALCRAALSHTQHKLSNR